MDSVTILRELWRRRVAVGLVALAAILVGLLLSFRPGLPPETRRYDVGIATARLLVDTPQSQVIKVDPKGSDTLGVRANVIANLMVEGPAKAAIAERAGLRPRKLLAIAESELEPQKISPKALRNPEVNLMKTRVVMDLDGEQLPIVEVRAQAPDAARATALANASVTGLTDYLDARAAADPELEARKRLRVAGLGTAEATLSTRGPSLLVSLGAAAFVFLAGCAAILLVSALARGWREAEATEGEADELDDGLSLDLPPVSLARRWRKAKHSGNGNGDDFTEEDLTLDLPPLGLPLDPDDRRGAKRDDEWEAGTFEGGSEDEFDDKDLIMDFPPLSLASEHDDDQRTNGAA